MRSHRKPIHTVHVMPGRIRLRAWPIYNAAETASVLESTLRELGGVGDVRTNCTCASIIVFYDESLLKASDLVENVREFLGGVARSDAPLPGSTLPARKNRPRESGLVKRHLVRFLSISTFMGGLFVRQVLFKRVVLQTPLSPVSLVASFFALLLVRKGVERLREKKFNLEVFLGASCLTAIAAGEPLTALEILWVNSGASLLEAWITERSRRAISDILQVTAHHTFVFIDGVEVETPVEKLKAGDIVVLHTGEKVSVDGKVVKGNALVDEAAITGVMEAALKKRADRVFAGSFVRQGVVYVDVEHAGDDTHLARILAIVEDSLENRAPVESVADDLALKMLKLGAAATAGTYIVTGSFWRAFTVLIVMSCPCATVLAASSAVSAALNAAARRRILIKGGRYLEAVGKIDTVCFDKTGTLTTGRPVLKRLVNISDLPDEDLVRYAYSVELHNHHPLAMAIIEESENRNLKPLTHQVCDYHLGQGVRAVIEGEEVLVGSRKLMRRFHVPTRDLRETREAFEQDGLTFLYVAREKQVLGLLGFANQRRPEAEATIGALKRDGVDYTVVVTGDEEKSVEILKRRLSLDQYQCSLLPEEKAGVVAGLQEQGRPVIMVGDGINDALALAEAEVGVAIGAGGSEVAVEAADIALVTDDLKGVVYVRQLSKASVRTAYQNFWIATSTNIVGIVLGALGTLSPQVAGLLHIIHTGGILANSSKLLSFETPRSLWEGGIEREGAEREIHKSAVPETVQRRFD